jgi:hypothetical protein
MMNNINTAKAILILGLLFWAVAESNLLNAPIKISESVNVFDYDFGDYKLYPAQCQITVDWGNTKYYYGEGEHKVNLKRTSQITFDLSWVPFFKHYYTKSEWKVEGFPHERENLEAKYSVKKIGLISRKDVIFEAQEATSKKLIRSFMNQSFYDNQLNELKVKSFSISN